MKLIKSITLPRERLSPRNTKIPMEKGRETRECKETAGTPRHCDIVRINGPLRRNTRARRDLSPTLNNFKVNARARARRSRGNEISRPLSPSIGRGEVLKNAPRIMRHPHRARDKTFRATGNTVTEFSS